MKNQRKIKGFGIILQIGLLICATFAFSYMINESNGDLILETSQRIDKSRLENILKIIDKLLFGDIGIASAALTINSANTCIEGIPICGKDGNQYCQTGIYTADDESKIACDGYCPCPKVMEIQPSDLVDGSLTCLIDKNGKICQTYPASKCQNLCEGECIETSPEKLSACSIGTCYDSKEGTCSVSSFKSSCENYGGDWFDDSFGNIKECQKGCCFIGDETLFVTNRECEMNSQKLGLNKIFDETIKDELNCVLKARVQKNGACVFDAEPKNDCRYLTESECISRKGTFHFGLLCSHPDLDTKCEKQKTVKCIEGKDEVYWVDSCGNQENIYDSNKVKSYNLGFILSKEESCSVSGQGNVLLNQKTCGNCDRYQGSSCDIKTATEKLSDSSKDFVCRDLSCFENGIKYDNGESWCYYPGATGIEEGSTKDSLRSSDTPGSVHYRRTCVDGKIINESCGDYRNKVCVESRIEHTGGYFSSASCKINTWQKCYEYNLEVKSQDKKLRSIEEAKRDEKCNKNEDCFLKNVEIDDHFKFSMCSPKYAPGFDLRDEQRMRAAETLCSFSSQKCEVIYVKKLTGWKCEANCDCEKNEFAEKMNDFCMSLGDCGTSYSINGDYSKNHKIFKSEDKNNPGREIKANDGGLSQKYIDNLRSYVKPIEGKYIRATNLTEFYDEFGLLGQIMPTLPEDKVGSMLQTASMVTGALGVALMAGSLIAGQTGGAVGAFLGGAQAGGTLGLTGGTTAGCAGPAFAAAGGALAGAAIAFAVVSMLLQFTGISRGLPAEASYALMAAGAAAGAIIGASIGAGAGGAGTVAGSTTATMTTLATAAVVAWVVLIVIIVIIIIFFALGIGDIKEKYYTFNCHPWQPPIGGENCEKCGENGLPCSPYICQTIGQNCQLINEGTQSEKCVNINPNDNSAPLIRPLEGISNNYSVKEGENGFRIESDSNNGCFKNYEQVPIGISLNEPAVCKFAMETSDSYQSMSEYFGGSNLFSRKHITLLNNLPNVDELDLPTYDPNKIIEKNMYVRCEDKSGNFNIAEYGISFCLRPGEDITYPVVMGRYPSEILPYQTNLTEASIFTNEPADCKWDLKDVEYNLMSDSFICRNGIELREQLGWRCISSFAINDDEQKYYVRCIDNPWNNNSLKRNVMDSSYVLNFKRTSVPLEIVSLSPDKQEIVIGSAPASIEIVARTQGGYDGTAICYFNRNGNLIEMFETLGSVHRQTFNQIIDGELSYTIFCKDIVGNTAQREAKINLKLDRGPPEVSRIYREGNEIIFITNEDANCVYGLDSKEQCTYEFDNGTLIAQEGTKHALTFNQGRIYYIKCKDKFGNGELNDVCSAVIKGGAYV
jgi:hypothetical protein